VTILLENLKFTDNKNTLIKMHKNIEVTEPVDIEKWERKRYWTTKAFSLECVMLGMEYSVTFLTLWLYIKSLVDTDYPKLFYSLVASSYLLAAVVLSVIIGRWVDRTRKIRKIFLFCNTMVIIGNVMYAMHFSPWFLVLGRLISGADGPLRSVISGEIARCYSESEVVGKFSSMGMAFALGFVAGPGVNFLFTTVKFTIGSWHVTYVNIPGVYMACFFAITQFCVYFMVHDLSREYDLKSEEGDQLIKPALLSDVEKSNRSSADIKVTESSVEDIEADINLTKSTEDNATSTSFEYSTDSSSSTSSSVDLSKANQVLCSILTNVDAMLVLILTFTLWYWMVAFDMWLPLMVVDVMEMGITELNGIVFGFGCSSAVILCFISFKKFSDKTLYNLSIVCMVALACMEFIFIYMRFRHSNVYVNIVLWALWCVIFAVVVVMDEVFLVGVMAKMTSSKVQTFTESLRLAMSRFGALLALMTSALIFEWVEYACAAGILFCIVALVLLIVRRKTLSSPSISIK